jgi:hypothetical protein
MLAKKTLKFHDELELLLIFRLKLNLMIFIDDLTVGCLTQKAYLHESDVNEGEW